MLIIDLLMPRMDGLKLAREIKARADLPITVLSAVDAGDNKADLLDEFAEDYITKAIPLLGAPARIQRVLRRVGERVPRKGPDLRPGPHPRRLTGPRSRRCWIRSRSTLERHAARNARDRFRFCLPFRRRLGGGVLTPL